MSDLIPFLNLGLPMDVARLIRKWRRILFKRDRIIPASISLELVCEDILNTGVTTTQFISFGLRMGWIKNYHVSMSDFYYFRMLNPEWHIITYKQFCIAWERYLRTHCGDTFEFCTEERHELCDWLEKNYSTLPNI